MFDNIGEKIKGLAWFTFAVEISALFIVSAVIIFNNIASNQFAERLLFFLIFMCVGVLISWCSVFLLYGFGELIERTVAIEENTRYLASEKYREKAEAFQKRKQSDEDSCDSETDEESYYNPFDYE